MAERLHATCVCYDIHDTKDLEVFSQVGFLGVGFLENGTMVPGRTCSH